jgi:hypothetical protein
VVAVFIVVLCIAALAVSSPIFAAFIVSVASRREDARWSLGRPTSHALDRVARRIVAFDADSIDWPRSKAHVQAEQALRALRTEQTEPETRTGNRSAA